MTPAVKLLERNEIKFVLHAYEHDANTRSFGLEAADKLGLAPARVFKTLVVETDGGKLAVGVIPVSQQLNLKRIAHALAVKKAAMASPDAVARSTGYVLGGVSPLAQKRRLPTVIDDSAETYPTVFVSAGKRGLDLELAPNDLIRLCAARVTALC